MVLVAKSSRKTLAKRARRGKDWRFCRRHVLGSPCLSNEKKCGPLHQRRGGIEGNRNLQILKIKGTSRRGATSRERRPSTVLALRRTWRSN